MLFGFDGALLEGAHSSSITTNLQRLNIDVLSLSQFAALHQH